MFSSILMRILSVIADIGGLLGLFLGCSLLSLVEIFFFIFTGTFELIFRLRKIDTLDQEIIPPENSLDVKLSRITDHLDHMTAEFKKLHKEIKNNDENVKELSQKMLNLEQNGIFFDDI